MRKRAAVPEGRFATADSAAVEHERMHAHLCQVNDGLACEAQDLHDGLERLREQCNTHAAGVRALEVGGVRLAHDLHYTLAAVDNEEQVQARLLLT
jgi:hypothetical protein